MTKGRRTILVPGDRFGNLVVTKFHGYKEGKPAYKCQCDCGRTAVIITARLTTGHTRSCGCLSNHYGEYSGQGWAGFRIALNSYKQGARARNIAWNLSRDEAMELFIGNCFYCGKEPSMITSYNGKGEFIHSGIDRVDSNLGYMVSNCVSCCTGCNFIKSDMNYDQFIELVFKIADHTRERMASSESNHP